MLITKEKSAYVTIGGYAETIGRDNHRWDEKTRKDDTYLNVRGFRLEPNEKIFSMEEITEWFMTIDENLQLVIGRSNMFCQIARFVQLKVVCKFVEPAGAGFVSLSDPERFPSVKSPRTYCLFKSL